VFGGLQVRAIVPFAERATSKVTEVVEVELVLSSNVLAVADWTVSPGALTSAG
jgi:hypothetical protein